MSFSISDIMKSISKNEDMSTPADQLKNPDLPIISDKFDDKEEIRDKALSAFKLSSQPRNGNYFMLPRTRFDDNPRKDAFLMDGAIDPNVIRKRVNPDKSIPSLEGGAEYGLYSLVPENNVSTNSVGLVRKAHESYVNYKNRFFVEDKNSKPQNIVSIEQLIKPPTQPAIPTIIRTEQALPVTNIKQPLPRTLIKPTVVNYDPTLTGGIVTPEPQKSRINTVPQLPRYGDGSF